MTDQSPGVHDVDCGVGGAHCLDPPDFQGRATRQRPPGGIRARTAGRTLTDRRAVRAAACCNPDSRNPSVWCRDRSAAGPSRRGLQPAAQGLQPDCADGGRADGGRVDGGRVDGGRVDGGRVDGGRVDGVPTVDGGRVDGRHAMARFLRLTRSIPSPPLSAGLAPALRQLPREPSCRSSRRPPREVAASRDGRGVHVGEGRSVWLWRVTSAIRPSSTG